MWDTIKMFNTCITGIPGGEQEKCNDRERSKINADTKSQIDHYKPESLKAIPDEKNSSSNQ